jgi:hypothetical protein
MSLSDPKMLLTPHRETETSRSFLEFTAVVLIAIAESSSPERGRIGAIEDSEVPAARHDPINLASIPQGTQKILSL